MPEIEGTEPSEGTEGLRDIDHDAKTSENKAGEEQAANSSPDNHTEGDSET
jgi:hypothetical protein